MTVHRWDLVQNLPEDDALRLFVANNLAVALKESFPESGSELNLSLNLKFSLNLSLSLSLNLKESEGDNEGALSLLEEVLSVRRRTLGIFTTRMQTLKQNTTVKTLPNKNNLAM